MTAACIIMSYTLYAIKSIQLSTKIKNVKGIPSQAVSWLETDALVGHCPATICPTHGHHVIMWPFNGSKGWGTVLGKDRLPLKPRMDTALSVVLTSRGTVCRSPLALCTDQCRLSPYAVQCTDRASQYRRTNSHESPDSVSDARCTVHCASELL